MLLLGAQVRSTGTRGQQLCNARGGQGWPGGQHLCYHPEQSQTCIPVPQQDLYTAVRLYLKKKSATTTDAVFLFFFCCFVFKLALD